MSYIVGHPVQNPADFHGRQAQISQLFHNIGHANAQSTQILGLKRSGKTSFLRYIAQPTVMVRHLRHPENMVMAYVDMSTCKTPAYFYYRVLMQLRMALGQAHSGFLWKESAAEKTNMYDVEAFLCHFPHRRIVLLLDDFDQLGEEFSRDFLTELRAMTSVSDYDLVCVTTSFANLQVVGKEKGLPSTSPFFNVFASEPIHLAGLATAVVDPLLCQPALQTGVALSAEETQQIRLLAGTLPFVLQVTAARWLYHKRRNNLPDADIVLNQMVAELSTYFEQWWQQFTLQEQQILQQLATAQPISALPLTRTTIYASVQKLQAYGLIVPYGPQHQRLNGTIWQKWVTQQANEPRPEIAPTLFALNTAVAATGPS